MNGNFLFAVLLGLLISCQSTSPDQSSSSASDSAAYAATTYLPQVVPPGKIIHKGLLDPGGEQYFYTVSNPDFTNFEIYFVERTEAGWSTPSTAFFDSEYDEHGLSFAPDRNTMFFSSTRPASIAGKPLPTTWHIWKTERINNQWSTPNLVDIPNLRQQLTSHPTVTADGRLFFHSSNLDYSEMHLYTATPSEEGYSEAVPVKIPGLDALMKCTPYVAPDGSYLLFAGIGSALELYITYSDRQDGWTNTRPLGDHINTMGQGNPSVTKDGQYLFYTTGGATVPWTVHQVDFEKAISE